MYEHALRATADLIPYATNSRTHSAEQVNQICASIREWGFTNPVLIDEDNTVIAGHGRLSAANKLGIDEVPCIILAGLSDAQKKAYVIADNQLATNAGWDLELLSAELEEIDSGAVDISLLGFDDDFIDDLLGNVEPIGDSIADDYEEIPEPPENPVTQVGDIWTLGNHRMMCGDSTSGEAVAKLAGGKTADLCFTSPPYAQQREYKKEISDWDGLMLGVFSAAPLRDDSRLLVNLGIAHADGKVNRYWDGWLDAMERTGWPLFGWYVWDKFNGLPGNWNGRLAPAHEFIFHFATGNVPFNARKWVEKKPENIKLRSGNVLRGKDGEMVGITTPETYLNTHKVADSVIRAHAHPPSAQYKHPAMFTVGLCEQIYRSYASDGDVVYEPFSGGGTSIIACEKLSMSCLAMELAPEYTDIAVKRWQDYTGKDAIRQDGATYNSLVDQRETAEAS